MAVALANAMYTGSTQSGSPGGYPSYDYRSHYGGNIPRSYSYGRPPVEPPRPLEPRPLLHTSLSESAGSSRQHNVSHGPLSPDHRLQGQNLPALKDILSPSPHSSSRPSYSGGWNPDHGTPTNHTRSDSHYPQPGLHPPMALHPPTDLGTKYQPPRSNPFDVPVLQTSPLTQHPPQSAGSNPYSAFPEQRRDYMDYRSEKPIAEPHRPYMTNNVSNQYNSVTPDDNQYRSPFVGHEQRPGPPYTPTGTDNRGSYLGVTDVPGEGTFYLYEGGHRIPTHVDGEQVNPAWGLTKANKPRKRLALACLDCREKKIKCEPGASSCLQCEKAKRTCRRAPSQTTQADSSTISWTSTAGSPNRNKQSISDPTPTATRDTEPDPMNKRRTRDDPSPPNVPTKKHRSASPVRTSQDATSPARDGMMVGISRTSPKVAPTSSHSHGHRPTAMQYEWEVDPFGVDPGLTTHLLNLYFAHINNSTYGIYPRGHFLKWLQSYRDKCQNERMVLYAMLAAATVFAEDNLSGLGKQFATIAGNAATSQLGKFNMTIAQTHMILCLYHFAKGSNGAAFAHYGSAIHSVRHQRLNTERACKDNDASLNNQSRTEFGLNAAQLTECKRRTFWSVFYMDRCCGANTCDIKPEDTFVRLPCPDVAYECGDASEAPYFSNGIMDPAKSIITPASPISPMAWLMMIAAIWGNVVDFTFRAWHRGQDSYADAYNKFYEETSNHLQGWRSRLPPHLHYSEENLDRSIQQGYAGTFISIHSLYHFAQIKVNRYLRHEHMSHLVPRNVQAAHENAHELLQLMDALRNARRAIASPADGQPTSFSLSTPFPGYATLAAIDIVGAGGWESTLNGTMQEIYDGLGCLGELAGYWASAREQLKACQTRYYQIQNILQRRTSKTGAWLANKWGMEHPLEQEFEDSEYDCIWGLGEYEEQHKYFEALKKDDSDAKAQPGGLRIV